MSTKQINAPADAARKLMASKKPKRESQEALPPGSARMFELMEIMVEDMDRGFRGALGNGNRWTRPSVAGEGMDDFNKRTYKREVTGEQST